MKFTAAFGLLTFLLALFLGGCVKGTNTLSGQFSHLPAPKIALLHAMPNMVKGGTIMDIQFQASSTSVLGVKGQILDYSLDNGETWEVIANLGPSVKSYPWTVPLVDVTEAIVRIRAFDNLMYESKVESPVFEIDSTPPVLTQTKQASSTINNKSALTYGGACESTFTISIFKLNANGDLDPVGGVPCAANKWEFQVTSTVDGKFTYLFREDDLVANRTELSAVWTRDTVAPLLTQKDAQATIISNLNEVNYGGDCETGLPVNIYLGTGTAPVSQASCANKKWTYKATQTTDGVYDYTFVQTDAATNSTTVTAKWTRDTVAPNLTQTVAPMMSATNTPNLTIGGACENGLEVVIVVTDPANNAVTYKVSCANMVWSYLYNAMNDGNYRLKVSQTDLATNKKELEVKWLRDTTAPMITAGSLKLAAGAATIMTNYIPVDMDAADTYSFVSHFCLKYNDNPMATPALDDACWVRVDDPDQPNLPLKLTLALRQYVFRIGYTPASYSVQAWVRDQVGNISKSESSNIVYNPGQPPIVINVMASGSDPVVLPFSQADVTIDQNLPVYVRWKISSALNGLGNGPVSLYYTTDDVNYTLISANISDSANGGCSLGNGLASGCYVWPSAIANGTYFRLRVTVTDKNGMITAVSTNPINGAGLNSIAGNTDSGVGASATAAIFISARNGYIVPDPGAFVVTKEGRIFFRDTQKGILVVNPNDGVVRVLMPINPANGSNTYEGPIPNAMAAVKAPLKIALDYQNGLLIHDFDRIRRIDLGTMKVSTIIGGATPSSTSTGDNIGPKQVSFGGLSLGGRPGVYLPLIPLPNGDIYFQSMDFDKDISKLRVFHAATQLVDSITVSGTGHGPNGNEANVDKEDLTTCSTTVITTVHPCRKSVFSLEYDPANSTVSTLHVAIAHVVVGNTLFPIANLTPSGAEIGKSKAPHPPAEGSIDTTHYRVVGRNGKMYSVNQINGRISRFDKATNTWIKLVGASAPGTCPDGTTATMCAIQPTDAFIDAAGNLFFNDRGRIRTVDGAGKVVSVYGQSFYFGDGGLAMSARFNNVPSLNRIDDGRLVLMDIGESRLREFSPGGVIQTIAGNGAVSSSPNFTDPASAQQFNIAGAGVQDYIFAVNPTSGDVYTSRGSGEIVKLNRATDRWVSVLNKLYTDEPSLGHYIPNVIGFDGTNLLVNTTGFDTSINALANSYIKRVTLDGKIYPFAGIAGPASNNFCADGNMLTNCEVPMGRANFISNAVYDATGARWLMIKNNTNSLKSLPADGSALTTVATFSKPATSFTHVRYSDGSQRVFYCGNNGRVYQLDPVNNTESQLLWRINSMNCTGQSMVYNPQKNSLIFPYLQNGLYGVGEYTLPQ